ncbi:dihydroorotase family protein [Candidatus Gracilibacteria bacterium]|nr:dihydroorotase family protein [Candidatus Gracilibacteria bacterium]MCF7819281.1 dihydroorotase family protein [Candidatus Gracilibacteria bacterium]
MDTVQFKDVVVINPDEQFIGDVVLRGGKISSVKRKNSDSGILESALKKKESTKILLPGLIDPHVHFRDPGFSEKEDLQSGSQAAAAGGVTTFFDMPNTKPPTFTCENLEFKRSLSRKKSCVHWAFYFGAGESNHDEIAAAQNIPGVKLYLNETTGHLKMDQEETWRKIFRLGRKVSLHAEDQTFARAIEVWQEEKMPCELHLCHTSRTSEVALLRTLKKDSSTAQKISAEVCPHHLLLTLLDVEDQGALALMKPEIGTDEDRVGLWRGVEDGTIDILATDHAPHTLTEKKSTFPPFGISGVETFFPLLWTEFQRRNLSLQKFVQMTSFRTRDIFHMADKKGRIEEGWDADVVFVDPQAKWQIDPAQFYSKAKWSPFSGWNIKGKIEQTFVSGTLVYDKGKIVAPDFRASEVQF